MKRDPLDYTYSELMLMSKEEFKAWEKSIKIMIEVLKEVSKQLDEDLTIIEANKIVNK